MEFKLLKFDKAVKNADFIDNAHNIYRTSEFIVKQFLSTEITENANIILFSEDTYYARTDKRDKEFDSIFGFRENIDGKRIRSTVFTRKYIE